MKKMNVAAQFGEERILPSHCCLDDFDPYKERIGFPPVRHRPLPQMNCPLAPLSIRPLLTIYPLRRTILLRRLLPGNLLLDIAQPKTFKIHHRPTYQARKVTSTSGLPQ